MGSLLLVARLLAGDAQAHAGHGLAPRLGNRGIALLAMRQPGAARQLAARAPDGVVDGRVDLVLHGAIAWSFSPTPPIDGGTPRVDRVATPNAVDLCRHSTGGAAKRKC